MEEICKNLFHWRYHLFYNYKIFKRIIFYFIFFIINFSFFSEERSTENFYTLVTKIDSKDETKPTRSEGKDFIELNEQDKIYSGTTILTGSNQNVEIIIYKDNAPTAIVLIKENTDLKIDYDITNSIQKFFVNYGTIRVVSNNNITTNIDSETVTSINNGIDCGFVTLTDKIVSKKSGYLINFNGESTLTSKLDKNNSQKIESLSICEFEDYKVSSPRKFNNDELQEWKNTSLYQTQGIPEVLNLVLEKLELFVEEKVIEIENEKVVENEKSAFILDDDQKIMLSRLLTFETGVISYNYDIGIKFVYTPEIFTKDNKLHLGFYFPVNMIPYKILTDDRFFRVNRNNNEWSFGTDINGNLQAKILDIVDDLLLKISNIRYNQFEDNFFINYGDFFSLNDFNSYSLVGFNSRIFYPMHRKSSFIVNFKTKLLDGFFYAEDVLPKGLYGTDLIFKTPNNLFKSKFRLSLFTDCYDFLSYYSDESFFPTQINTSYILDIFNVSSLGLSFYLSNGILIPFSYNFKNTTSTFSTLITNNPFSIFSGLTANVGLLFRTNDFNLASEFIFDSGINKVGLFDTLYLAQRENRTQTIRDWMESMSERSVSFFDYHFGLRFIIKYNYLKHIILQSSYQLTFPGYFDKLFFKIELDSLDLWKVNCSLYVEWLISVIAFSVQNYEFFQENNIFYIGFKITPFPGFDICLNAGMYPDFLHYYPEQNVKFLLDCYIKYAPLFSYLKMKKK